jgi:hypothetical protein
LPFQVRAFNQARQYFSLGVVVTDAIKYVQGKMDHLKKIEKALPQDIKENEQQGETEEHKTANGLF